MDEQLKMDAKEKWKGVRDFALGEIMTIQVGKWYIWWGILVFISFVGIKIILGDMLGILPIHYSILLVLTLFFTGIYFIQKKYKKESVKLLISKNAIKIIYDGKDEFSGLLSDFKAIRTLHHSNKKGDIQAELFFRDRKINLTSAMNKEGKQQFDEFCLYCNKTLQFTESEVPFSIWTHNWQGVKYVEYKNPEYREV
ncbi:hypothetical protein [Sinomicrobium sp.]